MKSLVSFDVVKHGTNQAHIAFLALGSNLGDREHYLRFAVTELGGVIAMSQVFETEPVGGPDGQDAYLNMLVKVETLCRADGSVVPRNLSERPPLAWLTK